MSERTHFVYTAYDEDGTPLYVGCTGNPRQRYLQHMNGHEDARGWFDPYVTRWHVSGPYPKGTAWAIEKRRITELLPVFNGAIPGYRNGDFPNRRTAYIASRREQVAA